MLQAILTETGKQPDRPAPPGRTRPTTALREAAPSPRAHLPERPGGLDRRALCAVILAAGVAVVYLDVIYRYFLSNPLQWSDEVAIAVLIAVTFLGAAHWRCTAPSISAMRALRNALTGAWAERADGFSAWVVLIVSVCLTWSSVPLLQSVEGQTTVSGLLPASIDYIPLPIGGARHEFLRAVPTVRVPARGLLATRSSSVALVAGFLLWGRIARPRRAAASGSCWRSMRSASPQRCR